MLQKYDHRRPQFLQANKSTSNPKKTKKKRAKLNEILLQPQPFPKWLDIIDTASNTIRDMAVKVWLVKVHKSDKPHAKQGGLILIHLDVEAVDQQWS